MPHEVAGKRFVEAVSLEQLAASYGSPLYVYSQATIAARWQHFVQAFKAFDPLICYAVKANPNLGILQQMMRLGCAFDIVSGGELERVRQVGGRLDRVFFSGVGKTRQELQMALQAGIAAFHVESSEELERLAAVADAEGKQAALSLRINPDVDARTHPYITTGRADNKFGIAAEQAVALYRRAHTLPQLRLRGITCHIGSQLAAVEPLVEALRQLLKIVDQLAAEGIVLRDIDIGGGFGITYRDENALLLTRLSQAIAPLLAGRKLRLLLEPGRALIGPAGLLLTRVEYLKQTAQRNFAVVDAAMTELLRPALYQGWHRIVSVQERAAGERRLWDIVGPVCESADFLGRQRELALASGDLLAICDSGAYGAAMSSNYNSRRRPAEVLVSGDEVRLIRRRESWEDLTRHELMAP